MPLDADIAGPLGGGPADPRPGRGGRRGGEGEPRAGPAPGARGRGGAGRRGDRARGGPARRRAALPQAIRGRFRDRAHHSLRPEARTLRGLGRPRADPGEPPMAVDGRKDGEVVIVGCGRVGAALAEAFDNGGHEVIVIDTSTRAFDRLSGEFKGQAHPRRRHRRGRPAQGRRRGRRRLPRADRGRQPERHGRPGRDREASVSSRSSPRSTTRCGRRPTPSSGSRRSAGRPCWPTRSSASSASRRPACRRHRTGRIAHGGEDHHVPASGADASTEAPVGAAREA